jgi:hypothetical protein
MMITNKIHNNLIESIICVVDSLEEQNNQSQEEQDESGKQWTDPLKKVDDNTDPSKKTFMGFQANLDTWDRAEKKTYNELVNQEVSVPIQGTGMSQINAGGVGRGSGKAQYMQGTRWVQNRQGLRNVQAMGNKIGRIPSQIGIRSHPGRSSYVPPSATTINAITIPPPPVNKQPQGIMGNIKAGANQVWQAWSGSPTKRDPTVSSTTTNYNTQTINQNSTYYPRSGARTGGAYR